MPTHTTLKGFDHIGETLITTQLEVNIEQFINWGLLCKGNFTNIVEPTSGVYGGDFHRLRVTDKSPAYEAGQVWQGYRGDWVWESGIEYSTQPIAVSGITVNGTFHPVGGDYRIDYPNGEVYFNTAIDPTSTVTCEYSVKHIHVERAGRSAWFRDVSVDADRVDLAYFDQYGSGEREQGRGKSVQLPVIVVETASNSYFPKGIQLGGGTWLHQEVHFYVFASNKYERDQMIDFLKFQNGKKLTLFDVDQVDANQAWLIGNDRGPSTLTYPDWTGLYPYASCRLINGRTVSLAHPSLNLYTGTVSFLAELPLPRV